LTLSDETVNPRRPQQQ